ncbi:MAG: choice-of-anchor Q domain-containing protein, partial [Candidatus Binataceae bacterium]
MKQGKIRRHPATLQVIMERGRRVTLIPLALGLLFGVLAVGDVAYANTITINSLSDTGSAGVCVLRDAITAANSKAAVNACAAGSGNDTVVFESGLTGTITLGSQLPDVLNALTINGPDTNPVAITIDGGGKNEFLVVNSGATLNLRNLTFAHSGGSQALQNLGTMSVANCTFANNTAGSGTILNDNTLSVANSTFSGNSAAAGGGAGGGILNNDTLNVTNSTFSGNSAAAGGAILNNGTLSVTNGTFSGNSASGAGGAIYNNGAANIKGTILSSSTSGGNCAGTITNDGYNISDDGTCGFGTGTGANGQTIGDNVNPNLDAAGLANNGGPTQTIALQSTSAAVDAIPFAACTFPAGTLNPCTNPPAMTSSDQLTCDQRGEPRPDPEDGADGACDIGAYELQAATTTPFARFRPVLLVDLPQYFLLQGTLALAAS